MPLRRGDSVILDTDMSGDCDDAGALSLLIHGCEKTGAHLAARFADGDAKETIRTRMNAILQRNP